MIFLPWFTCLSLNKPYFIWQQEWEIHNWYNDDNICLFVCSIYILWWKEQVMPEGEPGWGAKHTRVTGGARQRVSSNWERPWCTTCLQAEHSDVRVSHLLRSIPKAYRSHLQISLYRSSGLPLGCFPCTNFPYRRYFGIWLSAILTTCPKQRRRHCFSNVSTYKLNWFRKSGRNSK